MMRHEQRTGLIRTKGFLSSEYVGVYIVREVEMSADGSAVLDRKVKQIRVDQGHEPALRLPLEEAEELVAALTDAVVIARRETGAAEELRKAATDDD